MKVYGDFLPRSLFGYFHVAFAMLRMLWVSFVLLFWGPKFDVIFCDQVSVVVPILRIKARVLFYCHFPDKLLAQRKSSLKKLYRFPFDFAEEFTTGMANLVLVNSKFTRKVFNKSFPSIKKKPQVLYPCVAFDNQAKYEGTPEEMHTLEGKKYFLSLNRYEEKKNIALAVEAFAVLKEKMEGEKLSFKHCHLVVAGGYDKRVPENKRVHEQLVNLVREKKIEDHVTFLFSISNHLKQSLIKNW